MNNKRAYFWLVAAFAAVATLAAACGGTGGATKSITIGGFSFPESSILSQIYGQALAHSGYTVTYKANLGSREVVGPALKKGDIDLYPGYAATDLEYYNKKAGEATGDAVATTDKLNSHLQPLGLVALTPSPALDQNAFAVTKAIQQQYSLTKLSDLAPIGNKLVLGAGPECPTRPYCLPGLMSTYGIHFKDFKAFDVSDGSTTRAAFKNGSIQVGLVFSSDGDLDSQGLVVLEDDKHLEAADNVVPILRSQVATDEVKNLLNKIDAALTTTDLKKMNAQASLQHTDPDVIAKAYLESHSYFS